MRKTFSIAGYQITAETKVIRNQLFAEAYCPVCGEPETADDHGLGHGRALLYVEAKMQTHMRMGHGLPGPISEKSE